MFWTLCIIPHPQGCKIFQKYTSHLKILGAQRMIWSTGFLHPSTSYNNSNFWSHTVYITVSASMSPINVRCKPWWWPVMKTCGRTRKVCASIHTCACMCMKEMFFVRCVYMQTCMRERNVFCWVQNIHLQHFCKVHCISGVSGSAVHWGTALQEKTSLMHLFQTWQQSTNTCNVSSDRFHCQMGREHAYGMHWGKTI